MRHKEATLLARRALSYQIEASDTFVSAETVSDERGWREVFTFKEKTGELYTVSINEDGGETYETIRRIKRKK